MIELEDLVKEFAVAMAEKLERKQKVYGSGWKGLETKELITILDMHIAKAKVRDQPQDWVDVANFALFLWKRSTLTETRLSELDLEAREMASGNIFKGFM